MSEDINDILNTPMDDVSTKDPVLAGPLNYKCSVAKLETKTNDKGTQMLAFRLKLEQDGTSVDGEPIPAGRLIFGQIITSTTEKRTKEAVQRDLKKFMVACGVASGSIMPLEQWEGKQLVAVIGPSKTSDQYPDPRDEVKRFVPAVAA